MHDVKGTTDFSQSDIKNNDSKGQTREIFFTLIFVHAYHVMMVEVLTGGTAEPTTICLLSHDVKYVDRTI